MAMKNTNKSSIDEKESLKIQYELKQIEDIEESKDKYRKIVNAGITRWVRDFQGGHIKIESVEDLKKLIELDLQLQKDDEY
ncbi:hypothetical protein MUN89_15750 [Halobacillus salinarum]|uniref:Uncharacterized protein n=1 Tax=Halobacillus salinarum TaxID=2932257 RepID=A0ABY4ER98_9BACI|nr:hypothetical protein [Halobacillus salinarum]UOQ46505.1 hypothetical protein MUN89_15750 [Halobacillus salinarum]